MVIDMSEIVMEVGDCLCEELDYELEVKYMCFYWFVLVFFECIFVFEVVDELFILCYLVMIWFDGYLVLKIKD